MAKRRNASIPLVCPQDGQQLTIDQSKKPKKTALGTEEVVYCPNQHYYFLTLGSYRGSKVVGLMQRYPILGSLESEASPTWEEAQEALDNQVFKSLCHSDLIDEDSY